MAKESSSHVYGWKRQLPDHRDMVFKVQNESSVVLPNEVDLRQWCPPVMDQGQIGSCTAHGITALLRYDRIKNGLPDIPLSRLQLYYDERNLEGTVEVDAGAEIRDGIKVASSNGIAPETLWPYAVENFKVKPDVTVYTEAVSDKALTYQSVPVSTFGLKSALASGFPVVIGISIYQSFESQEVARTGIVPMPAGTEQLLGGHCIYVVAYNQHPGYFTLRNSWGTGWGDKGDFYLPEEYLSNPNLGSDYWIIQTVSK